MNNHDPISVDQTLQDVFGFDTFRIGQREIIEALMSGESALAVFPTGSGKSLCYQLPALLLPGMTLVVSPLIALMKDQIDFLISKGVAAARLDSSLSAEDARTVWDDLWNGRLKLLYVAPERFASERFIQRLRRADISLMVVDEAHCISEWGHNFRPDYMKLAALAREVGAARVLALTATATVAVAEDICRSFSIAPDAYINTGFHRPNLTMRVTPCRVEDRDPLLVERLQTRPRGATIVYVTLQKTAEGVAALLAESGFPARHYHAGLDSELRHEVQEWFMASPDAIVVATIAFGMGIDKSDIRYVYHYNLPKSLENYMQETGRAGRDGKPSCCELLIAGEDVATLENFTYGDTPDQEAVQEVVSHILSQKDSFDVSIYELSRQYDIRTLVLRTLLTYLELEGILVSTGPLYNEYKFKPLRASVEFLSTYSEDEARFLKRMLLKSSKAKVWYSMDIAAVAEALNEPRQRLVAAMNQLEEQGHIQLKVAGARQGYRFSHRPDTPVKIAESLLQRFQQSEARDIARLEQVVALGSESHCSVRNVLAYFGEELESDCGHCDRCLGEAIPSMSPMPDEQLRTDEKQFIAEWVDKNHEALKSPRQIARFLCGIPSPATTRDHLTRTIGFGKLAHRRFAAVMAEAGAADRNQESD